VVLNQGGVKKFQGGASPYSPYNMESFINVPMNAFGFEAYLKVKGA